MFFTLSNYYHLQMYNIKTISSKTFSEISALKLDFENGNPTVKTSKHMLAIMQCEVLSQNIEPKQYENSILAENFYKNHQQNDVALEIL